MKTTSNLLNLHAECIPVKGFKNSIICDLNRKKYYPITNDLFDILQRFEGNSFSDILSKFDDDDQATIKEYFDYLEHLEVLHWIPVELSENFPKIDLNWISSEQITNMILDLDCKKYSFKKLSLIISELEKLGCKHLQIRAYGTMDTQKFLFF